MRSTYTTLLAAALGILIGAGSVSYLWWKSADASEGMKLARIAEIVQKHYVEQIDSELLTEAGIEGMLKKLDPHSGYYPAKAFQRENESLQGRFEGIGVSFRILNDTIIVVDVIGGGPSAKIGIMSNDRIIAINDSNAVGMTDEVVLGKLRGPKGTTVKVSIMRIGKGSPIHFSIVRDVIPLTSVDAAFMLTQEIGYISINRFMENTGREVFESLESLEKSGMQKLIIDLRNNPGGLMSEAVTLTDFLLPGNNDGTPRKIVYTQGRDPEYNEEYLASTGDRFEQLPVIVLINSYSASASEIVAGALQDWDRGIVVGETSFGKGLVQRQWMFGDGSALRLTISKYYTPSGRLIQRPFKGMTETQYRSEILFRIEEDGSNYDHSMELDAIQDSTVPKYRTASGRTVLGGGGITPDFIVKNSELTATTIHLRRSDIFYRFAVRYMAEDWQGVKAQFNDDFGTFRKQFQVTPTMIQSLQNFARSEGVEINVSEFNKDLQYIRMLLKATIARSEWGSKAWYSIMAAADEQILKAVQFLPEAQKLVD